MNVRKMPHLEGRALVLTTGQRLYTYDFRSEEVVSADPAHAVDLEPDEEDK
jgi:hypothetical protein